MPVNFMKHFNSILNEKRVNMAGYSNLLNQSFSIQSMTVKLCSRKSKKKINFFQFFMNYLTRIFSKS